ncbi:allergen Tha p 1-like [Zerene cesonia]|uniref:allergen Tha p 1-like n=1 Tax=Zerene cesonia TaxID=33412 RepID=UPI0018E5A5A5|nr:allergen Tha p 1-like [Zerene cesonia]
MALLSVVSYQTVLKHLQETKMKSFVVICLFALVAIASARPENSHYTDRYDNVDLDEILSNRRLLVPYINCVLDLGKCSADGKELKAHIQEALEQNCEKCTEAQKSGTRKVIGHLINKEADYWEQLKAKFDPEHKYVLKYEKDLRIVAGH